MRRLVTSALWAGVITGLSVLASASGWRLPEYLQWLSYLGAVIFPAVLILDFAGRRGGPDGFPPIQEAIALTFLLLWAGIYLGRALWKWYLGPAESSGRGATPTPTRARF